MVLAFDVRLETPPSGRVLLRMECGEDCAGEIDLTAALTEGSVGEWQTLLVPLWRLADAGADMSRIDTPFSISTDGRLALEFSDVRLASEGEAGIVWQ